MSGDTQPHDGDTELDRRTLIRDVAVLQVKLIVDGLRDFILVPISLVAGLISLFRVGDPAGNEFYRLLRIGRRTERWINLFGAMRNAPPEVRNSVRFPDENMDQILDRIETFVVDEEKRGGITAQARERFEKALRGLQNR